MTSRHVDSLTLEQNQPYPLKNPLGDYSETSRPLDSWMDARSSSNAVSAIGERHEIALEPHWRPKLTGASYMDCN
ncbi:BQ5605_C043g12068 [Microbotryum silenes-dioicae]|uniref:BQ5605_C043g12068 protein n=1 Tax=Microbotryum silenes-dioicae TaxID=796604 RepID=A0A2X0PQ24_9BASI|nr:BQ5605_C043g12068 [Microbotryum silenes-dioicae]